MGFDLREQKMLDKNWQAQCFVFVFAEGDFLTVFVYQDLEWNAVFFLLKYEMVTNGDWMMSNFVVCGC